MNIYSLPAIISFTVNFSIWLIILLDNPKSSVNRAFSIFVFSFALWNVSEIIILNSANAESALFAAQILYRIIFLTPALFVITAYFFPKNFHPFTKRISFFVILFAIPVILLALSFPNFQLKLIPIEEFQKTYYYEFNYKGDVKFILLLLCALTYVVWGTTVLILKISKLRTVRQKNQTKFLLTGILSIFILYILINLLRTVLEQTVSYYFLATILTFLISLFFLLALVKYKIFNITRLIKGGITYSILSSIVLAVYFIIIHGLSKSLENFFRIDSNIINALIILLLFFFILPLERKLQTLIDKIIKRDIVKYRHNFYKLSRSLLNYYEPETFFKKINDFLEYNFNSAKIYTFVIDKDEERFIELKNSTVSISFKKDDWFVRQIIRYKRAVELYELRHQQIAAEQLEYLKEKDIRVILPLIFENKLATIIMLSAKKFKVDYSEEELERLSIFANEIAIAYQRNKIIEDLQERTKERFRLEKLAALGELTAGVAHEIRNPLNTISVAAETMLKKKISDEDQKDLQNYILEEAKRLEHILQDFLSFSKPRTAVIEDVNLQELFDRVIIALQARNDNDFIIRREIKLSKDYISSNKELLFQILLNLGINAIEAIEQRCREFPDFECDKGLIILKVFENEENIIISVSDNGTGIKPENTDSVFNPFFTTKETGTGLGLSIVHILVESLNGRIKLNSWLGKTEFSLLFKKNY